jgi:hypothetical protein
LWQTGMSKEHLKMYMNNLRHFILQILKKVIF